MCVILVGKITKSQFETALRQNGDGFSVYSVETGLVKAPSKAVVKRALGKFAIWHFRIGTSGLKDKTNIHPFEVCGGKWLLYHNGVLGLGLGDKSDTHALADTLYNASIKTVLSVLNSLSEGNRFLLVDAKDPAKYTTIGKWVVDAGVLMSHKMYTSVYDYSNGTFPFSRYGGK